MRTPIAFIIILSCWLITSCGGSESPAGESTVEATPIVEAFQPAAIALEAGDSPAKVGGLLMQRFNAVSNAETGALDMDASRSFVYLAEQLANKYPKDTLAALPLYRAAEVVRAMNDPRRAAQIYERIHKSYPTFSKASESLFMLAFTYDEDLNDLEKAKATYEQFIRLYPDNLFADDTKMLLDNLGKSDEEILKDLEEKAKLQQ